MNHLSKCMTAITLFLVSSLVYGQTNPMRFLYRIKDYPKATDNCHVEAKNLAEKFSSLNGVDATGECKAIKEQTFDIMIVYSAPQEIPVITTYPEMVFQDRVHIFKTEAACQERLRTEVEHFKSITKLDPFVTFCVVDETYYGTKSWAIRIDAFGATKLKPYWAESFMLGQADGMSESDAEEMIARNFQKVGLDVRITHLRNDARGSRQFSMLYYHTEPLNIEIQVLASTLENKEQCLTELEQVTPVVPANSPHTVFCANNIYVRGFELVGVVELSTWFRTKLSAEAFKTYADCAAARSELIDMYRNTVGRNVATGVCSQTDGTWRVNLLEHR